MQAEQRLQVSDNKNQKLITIQHFGFLIQVSQQTIIQQYSRKIKSHKKKKLPHKYSQFAYYQLNDSKQIIKILFINDEKYVDQGTYPFTDPSGKLLDFSSLNVRRLKTTQAAYIGHIEHQIDGHIDHQLVIKKMDGVILGKNGSEFQTVDDKFQTIKIGNLARFNQFFKIMSLNPNSKSMSIRVVIEESDQKQPEVIDFQFFYRQRQIVSKYKDIAKEQ